ncbi:MAG: GtrA family protein [Ruminococcaceae bacterium]|nr:GtrA family protein [Oscillospiraceae bacterium]
MNIGNRLRHFWILIKTFVFVAIDWCREHREIVTYIFFGGLTTVVDWAVSFGLYTTSMNTHLIHVIAWVAAVLFAFVTNKIWVFRSKRSGFTAVFSELFAFAGGRVLSLGVQELLFVVTEEWLLWPRAIVKIPISVVVVIINYILGKLVFHKKKKPVADGLSTQSPRSTARAVSGAVVIGDVSDQSSDKEEHESTSEKDEDEP